MSIDLGDVAFWVSEWEASGDVISGAVARKIAEYWQIPDDSDAEVFADDVAATIQYAKTARFDTIRELYALKAWAHARSVREQIIAETN